MSKYLIALLLLAGCSASPQKERVKVIRMIDGDTFHAKSPEYGLISIRLAYIDAPEVAQNFGLAAGYVLDSIIREKTLIVQYIAEDIYGRKVAVVYLPNIEISINEFMVIRGMAWVNTAYYATDRFHYDEEEAKKDKKGLWQNPYPIEPWKFRKQNKH